MLIIKDHISDVPDGRDISFEKDPTKKGQSKKEFDYIHIFCASLSKVKKILKEFLWRDASLRL